MSEEQDWAEYSDQELMSRRDKLRTFGGTQEVRQGIALQIAAINAELKRRRLKRQRREEEP